MSESNGKRQKKHQPHVLVTGGTGYIGSHTVVQLINSGHRVTIVDNLANSCRLVLERIKTLTKGEEAAFLEADINDADALRKLFKENTFDSVIHFAGCKAVGESKQIPLKYYRNNLAGTTTLLEIMTEFGVRNLVFSSSCTVYGEAVSPLTEETLPGQGLTNAYAQTKYFIERMLHELHDSDKRWNIAILRYFNPVGAHPSGLLGEDPLGIPTCLMPFVLQVLVGRRNELTIYGDDYETRDGTCIRDFIHVDDVAKGHLDALTWLDSQRKENGDGVLDIFNFGTGNGVTVKELVAGLEQASGKKVKAVIGPRRWGDLKESYCDPSKALRVLGWKAERSVQDMCVDAWRFQSNNPTGYAQPK